jgi:hypothetical protein
LGESFLLLDEDMRRVLSRKGAINSKPKLIQIDSSKQMLSFAHQHGRHCQMHLVDLPRKKILPDCRHASADPHVFAGAACYAGLPRPKLTLAEGDRNSEKARIRHRAA